MNAPRTAGRIVRNLLSFEERQYTRVPNDWVRDDRLSFRARGILQLLLSHKAGWSITLEDLARTNKETHETAQEGLKAIRTAMGELDRWGYVHRTRERDNRGRLGGAVWKLLDPWENGVPKNPSSEPKCRQPTLDDPTLGEPTLGEPTLGEPTLADGRTTEDHSSEDHYPEDQRENTTGHVPNVSTEARSANTQDRAASNPPRCKGSASGIHHPNEAGWCMNACGLRLDPITGLEIPA